MKLWISRDKDNALLLFECKPICDTDGDWYSAGGYTFGLPDSYFPEVTFENSPQEVEFKLVKK